jgi:SAM-dependent methyltransferase
MRFVLFSELARQLLSSFMVGRYLSVAADVGLFEALAAGPATTEQLAHATGMPQRTLRILANALVAAEFVELHDGRYHYRQTATIGLGERGFPAGSQLAARLGDRLLAASVAVWQEFARLCAPQSEIARHAGSDGLTSWWRLWHLVVYPQWAGLAQALREDTATFRDQLSVEQQRLHVAGIAFLTASAADTLARRYPFGHQRRVLDLGGGAGSFLVAAVKRHRNIAATLFELPAVAALARELLADDPAARAIQIIAGDFFETPIPPGYDAIILANVVHLFSPARNLALLRRIRASVPPSARLLLVDFWTDPTHTRPAFAALLAGAFQTISGEGDVYSAEELDQWLAASGWRTIDHIQLDDALSAVVAEAV